MMDRQPEDDRGATYEIRLSGAPPDSMRRHFPSMRVRAMRVQTVLFRRLAGPRDLDELLEHLRSLGLAVAEIHQAPASPVATPAVDLPGDPAEQGARSYEVRVEGELGEKILRYLGWSSCVVGEQKSARLDATPDELQRFLSTCSRHGVGIEYVHRLHPAQAPSTARAHDHDVLRRPGG